MEIKTLFFYIVLACFIDSLTKRSSATGESIKVHLCVIYSSAFVNPFFSRKKKLIIMAVDKQIAKNGTARLSGNLLVDKRN